LPTDDRLQSIFGDRPIFKAELRQAMEALKKLQNSQ
jgi:hypothetical protein